MLRLTQAIRLRMSRSCAYLFNGACNAYGAYDAHKFLASVAQNEFWNAMECEPEFTQIEHHLGGVFGAEWNKLHPPCAHVDYSQHISES